MSLIADLHEAALRDPTVAAAIQRFQADPQLDEITALTALVLTLVGEKAQMSQLLAEWAELGQDIKDAGGTLSGAPENGSDGPSISLPPLREID